jgi:serine/threonine-protein kinase PknG
MNSNSCIQPSCGGAIEDGYCTICGMAAAKATAQRPANLSSMPIAPPPSSRLSNRALSDRLPTTSPTGSSRTGSGLSTGRSSTGRSSRSSRTGPTGRSSSRTSRRQGLGGGLVAVPDLPSTQPESLVLADPKVPDNKRICGQCDNPLKREKGFCSKCGQKYSFIPSLQAGDLVAGQYAVKGAIAYGGLGWIYLAYDQMLNRYVVLKGLLNTEDASSAAVAVAERQFLASVKHPNIVGIYNFVHHRPSGASSGQEAGEGFIVMEYVGGTTLKEIRKQRGPLPPAEAIAYIHRILRAFTYLHSQGLVYCDFKPDNILLEGGDVKLIDLGGVRRIDDPDGDIYGTVGYNAPEAGEGPTEVSDLFTIGRTLAVLMINIPGFGGENCYTLPDAAAEPLFAQQESLHRLLLKATAQHPDDRFQSAEEMAEQLMGVLRELVSGQEQKPHPGSSSLFSGDRMALVTSDGSVGWDVDQLPSLKLAVDDPAFGDISGVIGIANPSQRLKSLLQIAKNHNSPQVHITLAHTYIELNQFDEATPRLKAALQIEPWEWRAAWYYGLIYLHQKQPDKALEQFSQVYQDLPGELAPKLAIALAAEQAGKYDLAMRFYSLVATTDPSYSSALFGLGRCHAEKRDRAAAQIALAQVPQDSSLYDRAKVETARILMHRAKAPPTVAELKQAAAALESAKLDGLERHQLNGQLLETALNLLLEQKIQPSQDIVLLGQPLEEVKLRTQLEKTLRQMARLSDGMAKIELVDEANRVRPKTLF